MRSQQSALYDYLVREHSDKFKLVRIPQPKLQRIDEFIEELIIAKDGEAVYRKDGNFKRLRYLGGFLGEAACEELLGIDIIEYDVGKSKDYNHPDLMGAGYNVGVKTIAKRDGRYPIIPKKNTYSQIICMYPGQKERPGNVWICGLATPEVLNTRQDISLVTDPNIVKNGYKTAFFGFNELKPIRGIEDIEEFKIG